MTDSHALLTLVGHMKVATLARLVGVRVEELVAAVLAHRPVASGSARPRPDAPTSEAPAERRPVAPRPCPPDPDPEASEQAPLVVPFPALETLVGCASYRHIHLAVDRWLLGNLWEQERHNVSRAAARLEISRRRFRELLARTQAERADELVTPLEGRPSDPVDPPDLAPLLATGTYRAIHGEADRWLLGHVLAWTGNNLTHAARHLDVSRKHLREHLARVGMR